MNNFKKIYLILSTFSFILIFSNAFAGSKYGTGDLKLSTNTVNYFIKYIRERTI